MDTNNQKGEGNIVYTDMSTWEVFYDIRSQANRAGEDTTEPISMATMWVEAENNMAIRNLCIRWFEIHVAIARDES